jgi:hypothetical protein
LQEAALQGEDLDKSMFNRRPLPQPYDNPVDLVAAGILIIHHVVIVKLNILIHLQG